MGYKQVKKQKSGEKVLEGNRVKGSGGGNIIEKIT